MSASAHMFIYIYADAYISLHIETAIHYMTSFLIQVTYMTNILSMI